MRTLLLVLCLLAFTAPAHAQQVNSLEWDFLGLTPTEVAASAQVATFNGTALAAPTCVAKTTAPTGTTCSSILPALQATNTASVALTRSGVTTTTTVTGITQVAAAGATGPRLKINITINLGS